MGLFHIRNQIFFFQLVLSNGHLGKQIKRTDRYIFKGKLVNTKALGPVTTGLFFNIHCCQSNRSTSQTLHRKSYFWWEQSTTTLGSRTQGQASRSEQDQPLDTGNGSGRVPLPRPAVFGGARLPQCLTELSRRTEISIATSSPALHRKQAKILAKNAP